MIDGIGHGTLLETLKSDVMVDLLRKSDINIHKFACDSFLTESQSGPNTVTSNVKVATLSMTFQDRNPTPPSQWPILAAQNIDLSHTSELRETPQPTIPSSNLEYLVDAPQASAMMKPARDTRNRYGCPGCHAAFGRVQDRKRHMLSHLPYWLQCPIGDCAWRGDSWMNLDRHHRKNHPCSGQEVDRNESMIYKPWPLIEGIEDETTLQNATQQAISLLGVRAVELRKLGLWEGNIWGRKKRKARKHKVHGPGLPFPVTNNAPPPPPPVVLPPTLLQAAHESSGAQIERSQGVWIDAFGCSEPARAPYELPPTWPQAVQIERSQGVWNAFGSIGYSEPARDPYELPPTRPQAAHQPSGAQIDLSQTIWPSASVNLMAPGAAVTWFQAASEAQIESSQSSRATQCYQG